MKIILRESQLSKAMKFYMEDNYPTLMEPLRQEEIEEEKYIDGKYRSVFTTEYIDENRTVWVVEYSPKDDTSARIYINGQLSSVYKIFGGKNIESFFKEYHGIDLTDSKGKNITWLFF